MFYASLFTCTKKSDSVLCLLIYATKSSVLLSLYMSQRDVNIYFLINRSFTAYWSLRETKFCIAMLHEDISRFIRLPHMLGFIPLTVCHEEA